AGRRPGDGVSLSVGNGDHGVVEGRVHMRDSGSDILAFAAANAGGFFAHSRSSCGPALPSPAEIWSCRLGNWTYFFLPAIGLAGPWRVRALVWVRWPRTGSPRRCLNPR